MKGPTSGRRHPAQILPGSEKVFEPIVVTHDPVNNPPTATDNTEFIEVISTEPHALMTNLWIIVLDATTGAGIFSGGYW